VKGRLFAIALATALVAGSAAAQTAPADPDAPDASNAGSTRSWLAQRGSQSNATRSEAPQSSSLSRVLLGLLLLAAVGGGALLVRRRRLNGGIAAPAIKLEVLASTRISPKAHAVVASVGGRVMLLGVTDHSVRRLAWISPSRLKMRATPLDAERPAERESEPPPAPARAPRDAVERPNLAPFRHAQLAAQKPVPAPAPAPRAQDKEPFRELLTRALGRAGRAAPAPEANDSALQIAEATQDHFERRAERRAPAAADSRFIEGQAAGLSRRAGVA
jgi:flagellar biogenesis protein FliO